MGQPLRYFWEQGGVEVQGADNAKAQNLLGEDLAVGKSEKEIRLLFLQEVVFFVDPVWLMAWDSKYSCRFGDIGFLDLVSAGADFVLLGDDGDDIEAVPHQTFQDEGRYLGRAQENDLFSVH